MQEMAAQRLFGNYLKGSQLGIFNAWKQFTKHSKVIKAGAARLQRLQVVNLMRKIMHEWSQAATMVSFGHRCTIKMLNHVQGCLVASMERGFMVWHEMVVVEQSREVLVRRAAAKMMMRSVARSLASWRDFVTTRQWIRGMLTRLVSRQKVACWNAWVASDRALQAMQASANLGLRVLVSVAQRYLQ
jgi:hypothetical protein